MTIVKLRPGVEAETFTLLEDLETALLTTDMRGWKRISDPIYHASSPISRSGLLKYRLSPANYRIPDADNRNFLIGRAFHDRISLTAEAWEGIYAIAPNVDKRKKAGKEIWAEFTKVNTDKEILTQAEGDMLDGMARNLTEDKDVRELLTGKIAHELACFTLEDNVWTKAKIDAWRWEEHVVIEFKTTSCASLEDFKRSFFNYFYDIQVAFYSDRITGATGEPIKDYIVLGFEKNPPYKVYKLIMTGDVYDLGRARYQPLLEQHKICSYENFWPENEGYNHLEVPNYLLKQI